MASSVVIFRVIQPLSTVESHRCDALNFDLHGVEVRRGVLGAADVGAIASEVSLDSEELVRHGVRDLGRVFPALARLSMDSRMVALAGRYLKGCPRFVRVLFFDKTLLRNWGVPWHQDHTVTVDQRADMEGWHSWRRRGEVWHVRPPCEVLSQMVAIRVHLDPAGESNGCLQVIPGTHRLGILGAGELEKVVACSGPLSCVVDAGDAVIMRPHVVHSSDRSAGSGHRRVVHLEYSSHRLPGAVRWA